jgi:hypothetical protein
LLNWDTYTETDNSGFQIQRKTGANWETIGMVKSKAPGGNSTLRLQYNYNDVNSFTAATWYRLQQVDTDGRYHFSNIVIVKGLNQKLTVFPNPSYNGSIRLLMETDGEPRNILIRDATGKTVRSFTNSNSSELLVDHLAAGYYTVQSTTRNGSQTVSARFIIMKQ